METESSVDPIRRVHPVYTLARAAFERAPNPVALVRIATRRIIWANAKLRLIAPCDEFLDNDFAATFAGSERELSAIRFDEFEATGRSYSMVRSFEVDGRVFQTRINYWMFDVDSDDERFGVVSMERFGRPPETSLTAWLDSWPQPCALAHRTDGLVYLNRCLRDLVGVGADPLTPELMSRLRGSPDRTHLIDALRGDPGATTVVELQTADGATKSFMIALAPLPPDADPDLELVVGHEISAGDAALPPFPPSLSPREVEVASLLLVGHRVSTIANALFVSPHTVRNHLRSIFVKTRVTSQADLISRLRDGSLLAGSPEVGS